MKIDKSFIALGEVDGSLNESQKALIAKDEISQKDVNLFLLLRGDFEPYVQKQIISNYKLLAQYHKDKREKSKEEYTLQADIAEITIYCDGACKGNPGESGSGLVIYEGEKKPTLLYGQYKKQGTNNTAELNALYKALLIAKEAEDSRVNICCDSKYSIDCITKWAYSWKSNGWKKKGGEIKNLEIIQEAHSLYEELKERIVIEYVKGHAGVEGNELADRMAGYAIVAQNEVYEVFEYDEVSSVLAMSEV